MKMLPLIPALILLVGCAHQPIEPYGLMPRPLGEFFGGIIGQEWLTIPFFKNAEAIRMSMISDLAVVQIVEDE